MGEQKVKRISLETTLLIVLLFCRRENEISWLGMENVLPQFLSKNIETFNVFFNGKQNRIFEEKK